MALAEARRLLPNTCSPPGPDRHRVVQDEATTRPKCACNPGKKFGQTGRRNVVNRLGRENQITRLDITTSYIRFPHLNPILNTASASA